MKDIIVIVVVLGFFALAVGYVGWCERIIASDAPEPIRDEPSESAGSPDRAVAESATEPVIATMSSGARR